MRTSTKIYLILTLATGIANIFLTKYLLKIRFVIDNFVPLCYTEIGFFQTQFSRRKHYEKARFAQASDRACELSFGRFHAARKLPEAHYPARRNAR